MNRRRPKFEKVLLMVFIAGTFCLSWNTNVFGADTKEKESSGLKTKKKPAKKEKKSFEKEEVKTETDKVGTTTEKKWQLLVNAGLDPQPLLGVGATVGHSLRPGLALEGFVSRASGKIEPVAVSVLNLGARVRKSLFGKIPYVAGGLGLSMASGSWYTYSKDQAEVVELPTTSSSNAVTLNLAAGGQMQFGSMVVGLDAVGIVFPLFKMGAKDTPPSDPYDEADFDEQKAKFNKLTGMTMVLCKIGVGIAF